MGTIAFKCPKCQDILARHCSTKTCSWFLCLKDKDTWVLKILKDPNNRKPKFLWDLRTYYPELMGPLPPQSG